MVADDLLGRLHRVRPVGEGRWMARCPAHDDKTPSLSIRDLGDGMLLLHCFGGCSVEDIVAALGMELGDLFPERTSDDRVPRERKPWSDRQLLEIIDRETTMIFVAACDVTLEGGTLSEVDMARLRTARERISAIMGALNARL